jgi:hypothetical protein
LKELEALEGRNPVFALTQPQKTGFDRGKTKCLCLCANTVACNGGIVRQSLLPKGDP